jgi:hypothetical protein
MLRGGEAQEGKRGKGKQLEGEKSKKIKKVL